ncbi:MAG: hypothetical protein HY240_09865 [Actinobacteria bacterium]|nr:hypothetical protein [Actinomycetota bacterium]
MRRAVLPLAIVLPALISCSRGIPAPGAEPDVLSGVVIARNSDGGHAATAPGVEVGVFRKAVPAGGPIVYPPPVPVATARTDASGVFRFRGLEAGRWFVQAIGAPGYAPGGWVSYDPTAGATITLYACRDCPVAL